MTNLFAIPNPLSFAKNTQTVFCDTDVGKIASQVISFQENITLMDRKDSDPAIIWKNVLGCPDFKYLAIRILSMFGSTYVCESGSSKMNFIKNKQNSTDKRSSAPADAHCHD